MIEQTFPIGTRFVTGGKHPRECTVVDILRTFNSKNELVNIRYVAEHQFMGQMVTDQSVLSVTIAKGLISD